MCVLGGGLLVCVLGGGPLGDAPVFPPLVLCGTFVCCPFCYHLVCPMPLVHVHLYAAVIDLDPPREMPQFAES